jgi:MoaA/NifB/PqqE/SkfB family radical SAM enzyme
MGLNLLDIKRLKQELTCEFIDTCVRTAAIRKRIIPRGLERLRRYFQDENPHGNPPRVQEMRFIGMRNLLNSYARALDDGRISHRVRRAFVKNFVGRVVMGPTEREQPFADRFGFAPPALMTISPTQVCNLACKGCYAASHKKTLATLDFDVFMRVLKDKRDAWGSHFTVISGGEPMLYESQGKNIFDCLAHNHEDYHLMYTNGVLIDRDAARRFADLGNVTPAISVEGWEQETDARRGKGVYKKILRAMDHLRAEGVPFGVSLTAMRHNAEVVMSEEFIDFWFEQQGAVHGWLFQYMPIGRGVTIENMVTSDQRRWMLNRLLASLYEDGRFLVDFWNGGPMSEGCIAAGRHGGYVYLNWNGDISPCVFFPYAAANIKELYAEGKELSTVLASGFFQEIRDWQDTYYGKRDGSSPQNLFTPCPIRDHHDVAHDCVVRHGARPIDEDAAVALTDEDYRVGMREYGRELASKLAPHWGDGGQKVRGDLYGIREMPPHEEPARSVEETKNTEAAESLEAEA